MYEEEDPSSEEEEAPTVNFLRTADFIPDYTKPYKFQFRNKTPHNGQQLMIKASFTGMTNDQYLGFTNETFTPIKYDQVDYTDQTFWIELFDIDKNEPFELGFGDHLLIEAVTLASPKTALN
jgi:hypothetical protein